MNLSENCFDWCRCWPSFCKGLWAQVCDTHANNQQSWSHRPLEASLLFWLLLDLCVQGAFSTQNVEIVYSLELLLHLLMEKLLTGIHELMMSCTSSLQVEFRPHFSEAAVEAAAESPAEVLPIDCRPDFRTVWRAKERFQVLCWWSAGGPFLLTSLSMRWVIGLYMLIFCHELCFIDGLVLIEIFN